MIRQGVPEDQIVKEISEKGYHSGSKQLDQEMDVELYLHLFKHQKETYLSVQRGKHRIPTILPDEYKYFLLKFPKYGMPILSDINKDLSSFRKLPRGNASETDSLFTI